MLNSYKENIRVLEKALQRATNWAKKYAAKFAPNKFELIHFINPKVTIQSGADTIKSDPIPPSNAIISPRETNIWEVPDDPSGHDGIPVIIPGDIPTVLAPKETAKYLGI